MPLLAKDKGGTDYEPLATGMHHAVCYGVVDLGTQPGGQFDPKRKVAILWEVPKERITIERDGAKRDLPRGISAMFTLSLATKGKLRPMLESWRGRSFTDEELNGFDLKRVLGANCFLNVVHAKGNGPNAGKTFANIASVNPLPKGMAAVKAENPAVYFSIDDCGDKIAIPESMPDWLKKKIMDSEEWIRAQQADGTAPQPADYEAKDQKAEAVEEEIPF